MILEFTKTCKRVLYLTPITNNDITSININIVEEGTLIGVPKFSFSFDDVNWTSYKSKEDFIIELNNSETQSLVIYTRVLFSVEEKENTTFSTKEYNFVGIENIQINSEYVHVCGVEFYKDIDIVRSNDNSNIFNPYRGIENAHKIRQQLSNSISLTFSMESVYFKNIPEEESKSILFKSYKVYNAQEPKEIGVMLFNDEEHNQDVISYQHYMSYENIEIEIEKTEWMRVFGDITPTAKDSIFIKLFNRMYSVAQVKDNRDFMNESVAYKIYLGKYREGVEINTDNSKDEIDNFSEFLAYDLEDEKQYKDEVQDALGSHDTIETTFEDSDTKFKSNDSKLLDYQKGIESVKTGLKFNGVEYQRFMYHSQTDVDFLTKYDISELDDVYTVGAWVKISELGKTIKLLELGNNQNYGELLYINSNGFVSLHIQGGDENKYITSQGNAIKENSYYGVIFSRFGETVIINVVENDGGVITDIQTIVSNSLQSPTPKEELKIKGDSKTFIGNIRVKTKSITKNTMIPFITNFSPDASTHIVIDNCDRTTGGIKVNTNI